MSNETSQAKAAGVDEAEHSIGKSPYVAGVDYHRRAPTWSVTTSDVGYGDTPAAVRFSDTTSRSRIFVSPEFR